MEKQRLGAGIRSEEDRSCGELGAGDAWVLLLAPSHSVPPSFNRNNIASGLSSNPL